jgi:hypothetical protein
LKACKNFARDFCSQGAGDGLSRDRCRQSDASGDLLQDVDDVGPPGNVNRAREKRETARKEMISDQSNGWKKPIGSVVNAFRGRGYEGTP